MPYAINSAQDNTLYSSFSSPPKTLDPARAYSVNENLFTAQIYEPPLQYHYLKRPYVLVPLTASVMPTVIYLDRSYQRLPDNVSEALIAYTQYDISIKPGIYYQPHDCFGKGKKRELTAADYVYQLKRLALPSLNSPILGLMEHYIVGLSTYITTLAQAEHALVKGKWLDLRHYPLSGVSIIDRYHYRILVKKKYPQFLYWLAMPFFSAIPWEADRFYHQPGMAMQNRSLDTEAVGTGAYYLAENNPNRQMVLLRNPNFHEEYYPGIVAPSKALPWIDRVVFSLEKESLPRWHKFLQGYYDRASVHPDSFEQAIRLHPDGSAELTPALKKKQLQLDTSTTLSTFYTGFNMLDPLVGGYTERAKKLRQAIAIALDYEEFIDLFLNGRGVLAQGPIPPMIFGQSVGKDGINPYIYRWQSGHAIRRSLAEAKGLLVAAGYPGGINPQTGNPLILYYDTTSMSGADDKARFAWLTKQLAKLGIDLQIRATQYNRFQDKVRTGQVQLFSFGWLADYPDPENFLLTLYGPNGKVKYGGPNEANYQNAEYDKLFNKMQHMPNSARRFEVIQAMLGIVRKDVPWIFGYHSKQFTIRHVWYQGHSTGDLIHNTLKYARLDPELRAIKRRAWNQPHLFALLGLMTVLLAFVLPAMWIYRRQRKQPLLDRY